MKKKNLNGIPGNICEAYFSSSVNQGQMASWLYYVAEKTDISFIIINILQDSIYPIEVDNGNLHKGMYHLEHIIEKQLRNLGFPKTFIVEAVLNIEVNIKGKIIYCNPYIIDEEGNKYTSKRAFHYGAPTINNIFVKMDKKVVIVENWIKRIFKSIFTKN